MFQVLDDADRARADVDDLPDVAERLELYRQMLRVRRLDERMVALQRQGEIVFYGFVFGQEAVLVVVARALDLGDWIFPALREGSVMLVRGYSLVDYLV